MLIASVLMPGVMVVVDGVTWYSFKSTARVLSLGVLAVVELDGLGVAVAFVFGWATRKATTATFLI